MGLTSEHVGSKILAKIKGYVLTRAELLITLCYEIPCSMYISTKVGIILLSLSSMLYVHIWLWSFRSQVFFPTRYQVGI